MSELPGSNKYYSVFPYRYSSLVDSSKKTTCGQKKTGLPVNVANPRVHHSCKRHAGCFAQKQGFLPCFLKGDGWCLHQIIDKHTGICLGVYSQANTGMIRYRSSRPNRRVFFIRQRLIRLLLRNFRLIKKNNLNYYDKERNPKTGNLHA